MFWKFLSTEVVLYLYKSTIRPCMEHCCHVWAGAPSCNLELLDKLQKWMRRTVGFSVAASLQPFAHSRNVASLSIFYRYYFGRCSSELAQMVLPDCLISPSLFLGVTRMCMSTVSFFARARLQNFVAIEYFSLTYDLNGFMSRINRHFF